MTLRPAQHQNQRLKQSLNPKMIQLFNIFHASYADLVDQIQHETEQNVFIEVQESDRLLSQPATSNRGSSELMGSDIADFTQDTQHETLQIYVSEQLGLLSIADQKKQVIQSLIDGMDDRGFFSDFSALKKQLMTQFSVSSAIVMDCLSILQSFEPAGVGARDLSDCLLIQLGQLELENNELSSLLSQTITHHLDDIASENYERISLNLDISEEGVLGIAEFIKTQLNPNPGSNFSPDRFNHHITPSFDISIDDNHTQVINLEQSQGISLSLSPQYMALLENPDTDDKTKAFLKEKYSNAKELMDNIEKRRATLQQLMEMLCQKQQAFIKHGFDYLVPFLQKDLAKMLSLNPSTVSRIVSSKYCRTPYGIFPLSVLCPRDYFGKTKDKFKQFVAAFLIEHPNYSDQKIASELGKQGLSIARRTVTKYRLEIGLPSSYFKGRA